MWNYAAARTYAPAQLAAALPPEPQPPPPPRPLPRGFRSPVFFMIPMGVLFIVLFVPVGLFLLFGSGVGHGFAGVVVGMLAGPIVLMAGLVAHARQKVLYQHGRLTTGVVVSVRTSSRQAAQLVVTYQYVVDGMTHREEFKSGDPPPVGKPVWVFVHPSEPTKSLCLDATKR